MIVIYFASSSLSGKNSQIQTSGTYTNGSYRYASYASVPIEVSDPSYLPSGTSSLLVTFSNLSIYVNGKGWISGGGFGPVNIYSLQNQSEIISVVSLPYNSIVSAIKLRVASSKITINGQLYNASSYYGSEINASFANNTTINGAKALLVSISPLAVASEVNSSEMQMRYSSKGYVIDKQSGYIYAGQRVTAPNSNTTSSGHTSIKIENASILQSGNITQISIGIYNPSSTSAMIDSVVIVGGSESAIYNNSRLGILSNSYASELVGKYVSEAKGSSIGSVIFNGSSSGNTGNPYSNINSSTFGAAIGIANTLGSIIASNLTSLFKLGGSGTSMITGVENSVISSADTVSGHESQAANISASVYADVRSALYNDTTANAKLQLGVGTIPFMILANDTLAPSWNANGTMGGITIGPDGSVVLRYDGEIPFGNLTYIQLKQGSSYRIVVTGSNGTYATGTFESNRVYVVNQSTNNTAN